MTRLPDEAPSEQASVVHENIEALVRHRQEQHRATPLAQRLAQRVTRFAGSVPFLVLHLVVLIGWVVLNLGVLPGIAPFDPFPFTLLGTCAAVEAIFLSTFVLIGQNRLASTEERHAELDLQINLLSEHEITHVLRLVDAIARKVGASVESESTRDLEKEVRPEDVLELLDDAEKQVEAATLGE